MKKFLFYRQCEEAMAVLQNDNEQLEQEKSALKERLKQLTKNKLVDDLMQKKIGGNQRTSGLLSKDIHLFYFLE
jgi:cell division protein FtsB